MENTGLLKVGDLVILPDARRAVIVAISLETEIPRYTVELSDGSRHEVGADVVLRARTYAKWVAPDSNWDGEERRIGRPGYNGQDRRRPD
ncbi:MAG: hypothetical protein HZB53_03255 [Chloroflexi bacterium]|nr:hypothetical protein [Chloroflexota bacterium]